MQKQKLFKCKAQGKLKHVVQNNTSKAQTALQDKAPNCTLQSNQTALQNKAKLLSKLNNAAARTSKVQQAKVQSRGKTK